MRSTHAAPPSRRPPRPCSLLPAAAGAQTYPEPSEPGKVAAEAEGAVRHAHGLQEAQALRLPQHPGGREHRATPGDKIGVRKGVYRESVQDRGRSKRYLRIVGDPRNPRGRARGLGQEAERHLVNGADEVTIDGFRPAGTRPTASSSSTPSATAHRPRRRQVRRLRPLRLQLQGRRDVELGGLLPRRRRLLHRPDAAADQADPPDRAQRQELGQPDRFSGTNMRYVTITRSRFYNNALGLAPELAGLREVPAGRGRTSSPTTTSSGTTSTSTGAPVQAERDGRAICRSAPGSCCSAAATTASRATAIYGNYLVGVAAVEGILLDKTRRGAAAEGNRVTGNAFGLGGEDRKAATWPTTATAAATAGAQHRRGDHLPGDAAMFPACPFSGANAFAGRQSAALGWAGASAVNSWIKHPHKAQAGLHAAGGLPPVRRPPPRRRRRHARRPPPAAAAAPKRGRKIVDNYYLAGEAQHRAAGRLVRWRWPADGRRRPRRQAAVRARGRAQVPVPARSSGYSFRRRLAPPASTGSCARCTRR